MLVLVVCLVILAVLCPVILPAAGVVAALCCGVVGVLGGLVLLVAGGPEAAAMGVVAAVVVWIGNRGKKGPERTFTQYRDAKNLADALGAEYVVRCPGNHAYEVWDSKRIEE